MDVDVEVEPVAHTAMISESLTQEPMNAEVILAESNKIKRTPLLQQ